MERILKELTHDFGQKNGNFIFVFGHIRPEILFDDHQVKTKALLDYKNMDFT